MLFLYVLSILIVRLRRNKSPTGKFFWEYPKRFFAHKIGLEEFELDKLLNGTLCLSPEIASSLERFWGIPASF